MITGFNTDIEYEGMTYHVQTEDKGVATPLILTLVYDGGTILASKRSPYDDLLTVEFNEKALTERLKKQHKLMCGAIRAGRIEDLKRMTMKESESRKKGLIAQKEIKTADEKKNVAAIPPETKLEDIPMPTILLSKPPVFEQPKTEELTFGNAVWDVPLEIVEEPAGEFIENFEEEMILPAEAVEIINDLAKTETTDDRLKIELFGDVNFKGGERKTISLLVWRGKRENGLGGAQILVKVVGATFRPLIFHAKTDSNGVATVHLQVPYFKAGRAAVLIRVTSEGEEAELRRVIGQG
ncbi:MAG: hypothetical protein LH472_07985 [Pyrinomonadaceae bacterium]|nr:hypothetical protein [Pyrinomonadaceae bacterium]